MPRTPEQIAKKNAKKALERETKFMGKIKQISLEEKEEMYKASEELRRENARIEREKRYREKIRRRQDERIYQEKLAEELYEGLIQLSNIFSENNIPLYYIFR